MLKAGQKRPSSRQTHVKRPATPWELTAARARRHSSGQAKRPINLEQVSVHLANELIFLAWTWTGMMLMGFGVAIAKMRIAFSDFSQFTGSALQSRVEHESSPVTMGLSFLIVGLLTILVATYRYLAIQNQLRKRRYTHADNFILVFVLALIFLGGTLIVLVSQMR